MKNLILGTLFLLLATSCISTKSTIKNIDDTIPSPEINEILNCFVITKISKDPKYGYNSDYPINVGFTYVADGNANQVRYLSSLTGPKGEKLKFRIKETCCPYPTKKTEMGAGTIDIFEITWTGLQKPILLYINKYEKGELMVPIGFIPRKMTN